MDVSTVIATVAVVISVVTFAVSVRLGRRAEERGRKPVLVFVDDPGRGCWVLENVGNGPALNVLIAQRREGQWFNPVRLPPLGKASIFPLAWLGRATDIGLGTTYVDFEGRPYTSTLGDEVAKMYEGHRLPNWPDGQVERYWAATVYRTEEPPRHPQRSAFCA